MARAVGFVVARQQMDVDALALQAADGLGRGGLHAVGDGDDGQSFVLIGQPDDGLRFGFQAVGLLR